MHESVFQRLDEPAATNTGAASDSMTDRPTSPELSHVREQECPGTPLQYEHSMRAMQGLER